MSDMHMTDKRKRSELSSTSSIDTSIDTSQNTEPKLSKGQKKKKAKGASKEKELELIITSPKKDDIMSKTNESTKQQLKTDGTKSTPNPEKNTKPKETPKTTDKESIKFFFSQKDKTKSSQTTKQPETNLDKSLSEINTKLNNVLTKDDQSFLKNIIRDTILEMKTDILASVTHKIELMEGEIHDMALENQNLKLEIQNLKSTVNDKDNETDKIKQTMTKQMELEKAKVNETLHNHEQYSRRNNVRIFNLPDDRIDEHSLETTHKVISILNHSLHLNLTPQAIDIAHRLGPYKRGRNRRVIVKFVHRQLKFMILAKSKMLQGTGIQIFEDLTKLNTEVLASVRKKLPEEIEDAWYNNGTIYLKRKRNGSVDKVLYKDYDMWLNLKWPKANI